MINKYFIVLCFSVYTLSVIALNPFFEKGQRPEIFELTDNEIPVFRVNLPEEDFSLLKRKANVDGLVPPVHSINYIYVTMKEYIENMVYNVLNFNYTERYPGYDFDKEFSGLFIGKDGFPDVDKIMENIDLNVKRLVNYDFENEFIYTYLLKNEKYDYNEIFLKLNDLEFQYYPESQSAISEFTENSQFSYDNFDTEIQPLSLLSNVTSENNEFYDNEDYEDYTTSAIYDDYDYYYDEEETYDPNADDTGIDFKTKNGTLVVDISGNQIKFDKITFSLSGEYSRKLVKPNFNLKIRGKKDLYGRSQFKLRSDLTEPTFLRTKLNSDIHNVMGLTSILANYATLYINDEYMGLFVLTDSYKKSWIEKVYGEKDTPYLYKCEHRAFINDTCDCTADKDVDTEMNEQWVSFIDSVNKAESIEDIEDIFEVDHFIYEMAVEYLLGAWDHIQNGHNYYLYLQPNGKWIYLTYDYDHSFGINLDRIFVRYLFDDFPEYYESINTDYPNYSFSDWTQKHHIIDILILKDPTRFNQAIKDIVTKVFNPSTLFPRIDELKEFIRPYAEKDYTPDENGEYPGRINKLGKNHYTFEYWEANSEFTPIATLQYNAYGIKYWILAKYRYVCKVYAIECDPIYLDENYQYSVDETIKFKGYDDIFHAAIDVVPTETIMEPIPTDVVSETIFEIEPTTTTTIEALPTDVVSETIFEIEPETEIETEIEVEVEVGTETDSDSDSDFDYYSKYENEIETDKI